MHIHVSVSLGPQSGRNVCSMMSLPLFLLKVSVGMHV